MPRFQYRALRQSGAEIAGELVAETERDAILRLQASGSFPIEVTAPSGSIAGLWGLAGLERFVRSGRLTRSISRLPARELILFTRQFAALAGTGVAIDRALSLIAAAPDRPRRARLAEELLGAVGRGESLSRACLAQPGLPQHYAMVIAAGEARGDIGGALDRLALVLERNRAIGAALSSALLYPASVLVVAALSGSFLLAFVVPRFESLLSTVNRTPPLLMRWLLAASALFQTAALPLALAAVAAIVFFVVRRRDPVFRLTWHRRLLALPLLGTLLAKVETERVAFLLGNLVAAGVELPAATEATREAITNESMRAGLLAAERGIERGDKLAAALAATGLFPDLALELVRIGEETGDVAAMLLKAGDILRQEVEASTAQMIGLVVPVSIVVLGLLIGGVAFALFGTVMEVYDIAG
ncbi:MAG: type II secretion system F family protein [Alphaproteobacteria bacterium]|nr:type II secretion system F family protein [Alphaproteobacteria bacterium]